jgi:hypothetical protein
MKKPPLSPEDRLEREAERKRFMIVALTELSRTLSAPDRAYIAAGAAAAKRLETIKRQNFHDWQQVAESLSIGEKLCAELAGGTRGAQYARFYSVWLRKNGLAGIDHGDRSRLKYYREHASEIDAWRNSLSEDKRRRVNHPRSVIRGYRLWKASQQSMPEETRS